MFILPTHIHLIAQNLLRLSFHGRAYFVGGVVRDLLLNPHCALLDVDVLVDGDVFEVSHAYAEATSGELIVHKRFLTATIRHSNGSSVDFVQARKEVYERPGALPKVFPGDLRSDSERRDFTINTLLVEISEENCSGPVNILDFHNGLFDLTHKYIKALHDRSFIDDPTRIFRAYRYKERISGGFDKKTALLIEEAIASKAITTISATRVYNELKRVSQESNPEAILNAFSHAGVLTGVFSFSAEDFTKQYLNTREFFPALYRSSNQEEFVSFLRRASCSKKFIQEVTES